MDLQRILVNGDSHVQIQRPACLTSAVSVRNGCKAYSKGNFVLNDFNMTVPRGTIYGLLGASGCGKTTMLSCIVGLRKLDSGDIRVFGYKPGTKESGIPGRRVGYMPQDIALYPHFSIRELLQYFGRIYGMPQVDILRQIEFLTKFLELSDSSKLINTLSGGQQRRASLATALVAEPELLILDEPTVGVDPLLRESIWDHLVQLTERGRTTVIITTHYIEEARQSHTVGLMRNGRLLTEKCPNELLTEHKAILLEDIVLKLCKQDQSVLPSSMIAPNKEDPVSKTLSEISFYSKRRGLCSAVAKHHKYDWDYLMNRDSVQGLKYKRKCSVASAEIINCLPKHSIMEVIRERARAYRGKMTALVIRNSINFLRNPVFLFGMILLPTFQTTLSSLSIGYDVNNMAIGVVNNELPNWKEACANVTSGCKSGNMDSLSCRFFKIIPKGVLNLIPYDSRDEAITQVKLGQLWGVMTIPENYSQHLVERFAARNFVENETLEGSTIRVNLDLSHYTAGALMQKNFYQSFENYVKDLGVECGGRPQEFEIPLHYIKPVYGSLGANYRKYITPGALLMLLLLIPMCSCGLALITDKKQGTLERTKSAGVTTVDYMVSFFISEGIIIALQTFLSTAILILGFEFEIKGSYFWFTVLCLLSGFTGQSWGYILGLVCSDETSVLLSAFFIYLPMLIFTGITWPLEAVPPYLRYFSLSLPGALPVASMRSIVDRGVGITHSSVWPGFSMQILWIVLSWSVAAIMYRTAK